MQTLRRREDGMQGAIGRGRRWGRRARPLAVAACLGLAGHALAADPNLARYGTESASSDYSAQYNAPKGNDNDSNSLWSSAVGDAVAWWQVDLGSDFRITRVELQSRQDVPDSPQARANFEVRGSNHSDGSGYTVLATQGAVAFAKKGTWTATVTATTAFRYLRVAKTDALDLNFAEFRAFSGVPVANGGFETGTTSGWTVTSSDQYAAACAVVNDAGTAEGVYALGLNGQQKKGNAVLSQTVATTARAGHALRLSFGAWATRNKDQKLLVEALDGGTVLASNVFTRTTINAYPAPTVFGVFDLAFTAASASTTIRFTDLTTLSASDSCDGVLDAVALYEVNVAAAAPTFSPAPGAYDTPQSVTLACATAGATIRYTVDGSAPTATNGAAYSGPITISHTTTLKAIAMLSGLTDSGVASGTYTMPETGTVILIR